MARRNVTKNGPHPTDVVIAANLKRLRTMRGVSQTSLAEALSLTFQQVQKYESGQNRVSASKLSEIATFLNVRMSEFFEGIEQRSPSDVAIEYSREVLEVVRAYSNIPPACKDPVRKMMQSMGATAQVQAAE